VPSQCAVVRATGRVVAIKRCLVEGIGPKTTQQTASARNNCICIRKTYYSTRRTSMGVRKASSIAVKLQTVCKAPLKVRPILNPMVKSALI